MQIKLPLPAKVPCWVVNDNKFFRPVWCVAIHNIATIKRLAIDYAPIRRDCRSTSPRIQRANGDPRTPRADACWLIENGRKLGVYPHGTQPIFLCSRGEARFLLRCEVRRDATVRSTHQFRGPIEFLARWVVAVQQPNGRLGLFSTRLGAIHRPIRETRRSTSGRDSGSTRRCQANKERQSSDTQDSHHQTICS